MFALVGRAADGRDVTVPGTTRPRGCVSRVRHIAAVAIANGIPLYTVNPDDFAGISELDVVAIPHPDQNH